LLPNYQNLCPTCIQWLRRGATADSSINDQLIKMHSTHSRVKSVLSLSLSYFVVCHFHCKIFNTTSHGTSC